MKSKNDYTSEKRRGHAKRKISRVAFIISALILTPVGFMIGYWLGDWILSFEAVRNTVVGGYQYLLRYGTAVLFACVGLGVSIPLYFLISDLASRVEKGVVKYSSQEILMGLIGLALGVLLAVLAGMLIDLPVPTPVLTLVKITMGILFGYIGARLGARILYDVLPATNVPRPSQLSSTAQTESIVLDASAIIDGRVLDIVRTGFLTGTISIPNAVLRTLGAIADSDDVLKRNRGRRGLDIVSALQKEKNITVNFVGRDDEDADTAVLSAAAEANCRIITNDVNLGKLAVARKLEVLNINDLANAIRPIALPGEKMTVRVVKLGKEPGQGVAYAPDGTMIVVENGGGAVGKEVEVVVTTSLQSSGGRMIFARIF